VKAWIDGQFVPQDEAKVPILSHSFSRGSAIFEVMEVVVDKGEAPDTGGSGTGSRRALFRLDAHVERFFRSAALLHMPLPLGKGELVKAVKETVRENAAAAGGVKFYGYYAAPDLGLIPQEPCAHVAVFCFDLSEALGGSGPPTPGAPGQAGGQPGRPATAGISTVRKLSPEAAAIQAKAAGYYVNAFLARREAVEKGYDDAIMIDRTGHVAEGPLSNVFFVSDGTLKTPRLRNALAGITRDSVIEVVRGMGLALEEADITPEQAISAEEAFYTGTIIRVKPIRSIEGKSLGASCPGPITRKVQAAVDAAHEGRDPRYRHWLTHVA